jgi:hypothetical protein
VKEKCEMEAQYQKKWINAIDEGKMQNGKRNNISENKK